MEAHSPPTLQDLCVHFICGNLDRVCQLTGDTPCFFSRTKEYFVHRQVSELLLEQMGRHGKVTNQTLRLFDADKTQLETAKITDAFSINPTGMSVLNGHRLKELEMTGLQCGIKPALEAALGEFSRDNLRVLRLRRCMFNPRADMGWNSLAEAEERDDLVLPKELRFLDLAESDLTSIRLGRLVRGLQHLQHLDISGTRVHDMSSLQALPFLRSLALRDVQLDGATAALLARCLPNLTHLDASTESGYTGSRFAPGVICHPERFQHLVWLDLSGRDCEPDWYTFRAFLAGHPDLKFIGLLGWDICESPGLQQPEEELTIAGGGSESQLSIAMKMYLDRPMMIQRCLYILFKSGWVSSGLVTLLAQGAEMHPSLFGVQVAATACFYNMTRGSSQPRPLLSRVVRLTLEAMQNFPGHFQLQKNGLLTLCSDRVLQEAEFDRLRAGRLVLEALCTFDDPSMTRMAVAVTSILAAKVNTSDGAALGGQAKYVARLLAIVRAKAIANQLDITAKFSLSALWNLTDESPGTCNVFLAQGGLELFQLALSAWEGRPGAETKLLGLLNNVAEVETLRPALLAQAEFIPMMFKLLRSEHIDVSYFAAGVLAHLASDGAEKWDAGQKGPNSIEYEKAVGDLRDAVEGWKAPDGEMVAYRSFRPFFRLLGPTQHPAVQLWAMWAIHHVCTRNATRYGPMLLSEGGHHLLASMLSQPTSSPKTAPMCSSVLEVLEQHSFQDAAADNQIQRHSPSVSINCN